MTNPLFKHLLSLSKKMSGRNLSLLHDGSEDYVMRADSCVSKNICISFNLNENCRLHNVMIL